MIDDGVGPHGGVTYNVETNAYHASYHPDDRGALLGAIIDLVSLVTGKEPETMTPLYDVVDVDAMEALFQPRDGNAIEVVFQYYECEVAARSSGDVIVVPLEIAA